MTEKKNKQNGEVKNFSKKIPTSVKVLFSIVLAQFICTTLLNDIVHTMKAEGHFRKLAQANSQIAHFEQKLASQGLNGSANGSPGASRSFMGYDPFLNGDMNFGGYNPFFSNFNNGFNNNFFNQNYPNNFSRPGMAGLGGATGLFGNNYFGNNYNPGLSQYPFSQLWVNNMGLGGMGNFGRPSSGLGNGFFPSYGNGIFRGTSNRRLNN